MGTFQIGVTVANPADAARNFAERFWVDTGALYTFIPEDPLHAIAVEPLLSRNLILADGHRERRLLGEARLTIEGLEGALTCPIIFAPSGSPYLLGATALAPFGVDVDPIAQRVKPILVIVSGDLGSMPGRVRRTRELTPEQGLSDGRIADPDLCAEPVRQPCLITPLCPTPTQPSQAQEYVSLPRMRANRAYTDR